MLRFVFSRILASLLVALIVSPVGLSVGDDNASSPSSAVSVELLRKVNCIVDQQRKAVADHAIKYKDAWVFFSSTQAARKFRDKPQAFEAFANFQLVQTKQYVQHACPLSGEQPDEDSAIINVGGVDIEVLCADCAKDIGKEPLADQIELLFDAEGFEFGQFALAKRTKNKAATVE